MKLLTVIVPSYNMERYLPKCLDSLAVGPGLMDEMDVIIVNDGSKDRTSEIAHAFASRWPESVQVVDKPNGHYGSCINAGLDCARGIFIRVLDADDTYEREGFAAFLRRLDNEVSNPPDFVLTDCCRVFEGDPLRIANSSLPFADGARLTVADVCPDRFEYGQLVLTYRTDLVRKIGYRQTEGIPYTDFEWCTIPMSSARRGVYFSHCVYRYLIGREGQSVSVGVQIANRQAMVEVLKTLLTAHERLLDCPPEGLAFLETQTACHLERICKFYGLHAPLWTVRREVSELLRLVRCQTWLQRRVGDLRYASFLLGSPNGVVARLLALRGYARLRALCDRL